MLVCCFAHRCLFFFFDRQIKNTISLRLCCWRCLLVISAKIMSDCIEDDDYDGLYRLYSAMTMTIVTFDNDDHEF